MVAFAPLPWTRKWYPRVRLEYAEKCSTSVRTKLEWPRPPEAKIGVSAWTKFACALSEVLALIA